MAATPIAMETTPRTDADGHVVDQELQLTPDELELLLETTTPTADDDNDGRAPFRNLSLSPHTSGDDASSEWSGQHASDNDPLNAKRARRSEIEKLSRRRRQATLRGMRDEVRQLESKMAELLLAAEKAKEQDAAVVTVTKQRVKEVSVSADLETLRGRFIQLSLEAQRLEGEKTDLRRMLRSRQLLSQSVQSLADAFIEDWEEDGALKDMITFMYEPLARDELFGAMRTCFERVVAYDACGDFISSGNAFMGWVDRRRQEDDGMLFSFTKSFPGRDPERVMLDSWKMFTDAEGIRRNMARVQAYVTLEILQQPNEDVVVMYRRTHSTQKKKTFTTVFILFRLRTDDGYTICFRSVPTPAIQESLQDDEIWVDMFQWIHFQHLNNDDARGCRVLFGGAVLGEMPGTIAEFLLHSFHAVVRWETMCLGPLFLLPSSDSSQAEASSVLVN